MSLRTVDFESTASTIPPSWLKTFLNYHGKILVAKVTFFKLSVNDLYQKSKNHFDADLEKNSKFQKFFYVLQQKDQHNY